DRMFDPDGQLNYPVSDKSDAPWVPEFFGNATLVNGTLFPYFEVEPRKYRFRVLNASNARFHHLSLSDGQPFYQIGSDQGLLSAPVQLNNLFVAPAERADLIIDFAGRAGEEITLKDEALGIMQFRVLSGTGKDASSLPATLRPEPGIPESHAVKTRV